MGCCVSTPKKSITQKQEQISSPPQIKNHDNHNVSKSPPRAEEEAVKEVLSVSETPKPKPRSPQIPKINKNYKEFLPQPTEISPTKLKNATQNIPTLLGHQNHPNEEEEEEAKYSQPLLVTSTTTATPPTALTPEENSEVSDFCNLSEISASTATVSHADRRGEEDDDQRSRDESEVCQQQRLYRSPVKSRPYRNGYGAPGSSNVRREGVTGRSPVRRSDPSPTGRRNFRVGTGQNGAVRSGGLGVEGNRDGRGQRRDFSAGEQSGRRSRSPAINRNDCTTSGGWNRSTNLGRSPSIRKTSPSPGRVRVVRPTENGKKVEEIHSNGRTTTEEGGQEEQEKWASNYTPTGTSSKATNNASTTNPADESLENPLVSLECFIFL